MTLASYVQGSAGLQIHLDATRAESYKAFGTKLWNAARYVFSHVHAPGAAGASPLPVFSAAKTSSGLSDLGVADKWILSRLAVAATACHDGITNFNLAAAVNAAYRFSVTEFCDVYVEWSKTDLSSPQHQARGP